MALKERFIRARSSMIQPSRWVQIKAWLDSGQEEVKEARKGEDMELSRRKERGNSVGRELQGKVW